MPRPNAGGVRSGGWGKCFGNGALALPRGGSVQALYQFAHNLETVLRRPIKEKPNPARAVHYATISLVSAFRVTQVTVMHV
ncbi:MAG TPA: hypothetical protein VJ755_02545 [Gemmatimonadales bacterium]|nr:hypothetical protein [Gemmatimonadales bacterium]